MFYTSIINEFNVKLERLEVSYETELKKAAAGIRIASWALDALKEQIVGKGFVSLQEEISFFRTVKCVPMKYLIHFTEIRSCELRMPKSDVKAKLAFLDKQIEKVNQFFGRHTEFLLYMEQGYSHFDEYYFTRKNLHNNPVVKSYPYYKDSIFNTSHDEIWARIKGLAMYANYLRKKKEQLTSKLQKSGFDKLKWTGSYAAFVELVYGLQAIGYLNQGNHNIKLIMEVLGEVLQVPKGNHSRTYNELKSRKSSRIKFFEEVGEKLLDKMDNEDGLND
ncbi:hypothetical protein FVB32_10335 [Flagellimonas hymeniacidonis]|uniref:RteC protein n=1 Tax=Flagellimonas hymeniacidonis TaxID=2603628 RepID=A0A5C8V0Y2_9FLAO|nr:RteC domain-containing protein [Flagellimonas hymeniacidonis]TXN34986.1 hypothetical protein FVB32_10335 [Flagellimonas hymeniacidonis]